MSSSREIAARAKAWPFEEARRLVEACVEFARARGYRRVTLWTHKELTAARAIYAKLGFVKTGEESHDDWHGKATSEFWDLNL